LQRAEGLIVRIPELREREEPCTEEMEEELAERLNFLVLLAKIHIMVEKDLDMVEMVVEEVQDIMVREVLRVRMEREEEVPSSRDIREL
jgi:hypothetical protein